MSLNYHDSRIKSLICTRPAADKTGTFPSYGPLWIEEGTWNGSTITSKTRQQSWTLDHAGNWAIAKLDLDGSGWDEEDTRTHNDANELTARDTDSDTTDDHTLVYDEVGNLVDDDKAYKYVYDAFGRLRKMLNQSDELVAEYVYNGLGHRIGVHYDVDEDTDVDGDDVWYWFAYDERWRIVGTFRDDDEDPKEIFVYHAAGLGGFGGSSYIDSVILRDRDANTDWDAASDGTLEERTYYCQNWRHDVVALIDDSGGQVQQVRYSAYGVPFGLPAGDMDSDGDVDNDDDTDIASAIIGTYDVRGDMDLDGVVDNADRTALQSRIGDSLGRGVLALAVDHSEGGGGNRKGYAGYEGDYSRDGFWHVRHRVLDCELGRWTRRDPLATTGLGMGSIAEAIRPDFWVTNAYPDGPNIYQYSRSHPSKGSDPTGLVLWTPHPLLDQYDCAPDYWIPNVLSARYAWKCACCSTWLSGCGAWTCGAPAWLVGPSVPLPWPWTGQCACTHSWCISCTRPGCSFLGCSGACNSCSGTCGFIVWLGAATNCAAACAAAPTPCVVPAPGPRLPAPPPCNV